MDVWNFCRSDNAMVLLYLHCKFWCLLRLRYTLERKMKEAIPFFLAFFLSKCENVFENVYYCFLSFPKYLGMYSFIILYFLLFPSIREWDTSHSWPFLLYPSSKNLILLVFDSYVVSESLLASFEKHLVGSLPWHSKLSSEVWVLLS